MPSFNIYVPSYKRSNAILTNNLVEYCTYVVRKSEEKLYEEQGVNVLAVEDNKIDSLIKVENWILENAEEDVVCILDDDIEKIYYRLETNEEIVDKTIITQELERIAQIIYDLDLGYGSTPSDTAPMYYDKEFKFVGITGPIKWFNRKKCTSRFTDIPFLNDIDFEMQELVKNRIIVIPNYLVQSARLDVNEGGSNEVKTAKMFEVAKDTMKRRWGMYFDKGSEGKPAKIRVKR